MLKKNTKARKRFGQNFLQDGMVIEQILNAINPQENDVIAEIGPGHGALTLPLLARVNKLTAIEIDRDLVEQLNARVNSDRLTLIAKDVLHFDFSSLTKDADLRIVGNLPYNISTPLLFHLLQFKDCIADMYFMLQREVAHNLSACPREHNYSRLSVIAQYFFESEILFDVPPQAFFPAPAVISSFVRMSVRQEALLDNLEKLDCIVKLAFTKRRKTLANALSSIFDEQAWNEMQIDRQKRPDSVSLEEYMQMVKYFNKQKNGTN